ncbi:MAG: NADH-quinone oxidoreductase subunit NuoK [Thermoguttaceae bacterium]
MNNELALLNHYLVVGAILFGIGVIGFVSRRNMIVMFLAAEMMLQGISVSFIAWSRYHNDWGGQMFVVFIITVAACEAAIALALVLMLFRHSDNLDIAPWHHLRESNQPAYVDEEIPEPAPQPKPWPALPPTGSRPEPDPADIDFRRQV